MGMYSNCSLSLYCACFILLPMPSPSRYDCWWQKCCEQPLQPLGIACFLAILTNPVLKIYIPNGAGQKTGDSSQSQIFIITKEHVITDALFGASFSAFDSSNFVAVTILFVSEKNIVVKKRQSHQFLGQVPQVVGIFDRAVFTTFLSKVWGNQSCWAFVAFGDPVYAFLCKVV